VIGVQFGNGFETSTPRRARDVERRQRLLGLGARDVDLIEARDDDLGDAVLLLDGDLRGRRRGDVDGRRRSRRP